jgi:acyl-CoA thioesterase FadM
MGARLHAKGSAKLVWVDMTTGKSSAIPARIVALAREARE